jgi:hypothetical protein
MQVARPLHVPDDLLPLRHGPLSHLYHRPPLTCIGEAPPGVAPLSEAAAAYEKADDDHCVLDRLSGLGGDRACASRRRAHHRVRTRPERCAGTPTVTVKNEQTGDERTLTANPEALFAIAGLRPSTYSIKGTFGQLKPAAFDGLLHAVEWPPDVAALSAGTRCPEQRHGGVRGHPFQRPGRPAEHDPLRRHRGHGHHRCVAWKPERGDPLALSPPVEPRKRAGVPGRLEQLSGRSRNRHWRPDRGGDQVRDELSARFGVLLHPRRQVRLEELLRLAEEPSELEAIRRISGRTHREG